LDLGNLIFPGGFLENWHDTYLYLIKRGFLRGLSEKRLLLPPDFEQGKDRRPAAMVAPIAGVAGTQELD
jgi:hypothetical protein